MPLRIQIYNFLQDFQDNNNNKNNLILMPF